MSQLGPTASVLTTITLVLQILNSAEPDIAAIIKLFQDSSLTLQQILDDADKTEQDDINKIQGELK